MRMSWCTRFQTVSSYIFCLSEGTSDSSETLGLPRAPM